MDVCTHCGFGEPSTEPDAESDPCPECGAEWFINGLTYTRELASLRARIAAAVAECERMVSESHAAHPDRSNRRERAKCAVAIRIRAVLEGR